MSFQKKLRSEYVKKAAWAYEYRLTHDSAWARAIGSAIARATILGILCIFIILKMLILTTFDGCVTCYYL